MPFCHTVFHILHAAAFLGMQQDADRLGPLFAAAHGQRIEHFVDLLHVVAVGQLAHVPAKGCDALAKIVGVDRLADEAAALAAVLVHDHNEIAELVVARVHDRLPVRAFLQLAVADKAVDPAFGAIDTGRHGHADGDGHPVAQRAGADFKAGIVEAVRMLAPAAHIRLIFVHQLFTVIETDVGKDAVHNVRIVALGEDEAVTLRIIEVILVEIQELLIKRGQDVRGGKRAAQMGIAGNVRQIDQCLAVFRRLDLQRADLFRLFSGQCHDFFTS